MDFKNPFESALNSPVEVVSDKVLRINLREGGYVDGTVISTKDGSSLKSAIKRALGDDRKIVVMPRSC